MSTIESKFNGYSKVTDWNKVYFLMQQANSEGFNSATKKEVVQELFGDAAIQGADYYDLPVATSSAVVPLPIPTVPNKFGFLANGKYSQPTGGNLEYSATQWGLTLFDGNKWIKKFTLDLPIQQGVSVLNPTGNGLPTEAATADYVQPLFDTINELESKIEELTEHKEALIIDNLTPTIVSAVTGNAKNEISIINTNGSILTGDFTVWGVSTLFPATVKYIDGTYENVMVLSFTSTTATINKMFTKDVEKISNVHDVVLGQHLTDLAYKEMGYRLYNSDYRHSFRQTLVKAIDMNSHTISNGIVTNTATGKQVLTLRTLNSYPSNYTGIGPFSVSYSEINSPRMNMYPTNIVGRGIEFDFDSIYNGFFEIFIGTRITGTQNIGGVDTALVGGIQVQFLDKNTGNVLYEKYIKGQTERVLFDHGKGKFTIKIFVPIAEYTSAIISQMYWWKKRTISPQRKIFTKNDKILLFTDSWGMYPVENNPDLQVKMFDGFKINGRCSMPMEFKSRFVADGGNPDNILLATRGGMTTVWAKHWIDYIVSSVKPTKIVFHFGINDYNSIAFHNDPENGYKFDPLNIWATKNISAGGKIGSIPDVATYKANLLDLKNYCIEKGIVPIFFTTPKTASSSQAQSLSNVARDVFFKGLK